MATAIRLENVRLSFPDLFEASEYEGKWAYRAAFLIEPGSKTDKDIEAAIKVVAKDKWNDKADGILKRVPRTSKEFCYYSGDLKEYDGYAGNMALSTTRGQDKGRPGIYDKDKSPLTAADGKPYPGCYVNAQVEFWAQDNKHGKTVRCTLIGVQFRRDGDAFTAGTAPDADAFEDISEGADADDLV